jgi:hypothetical protein
MKLRTLIAPVLLASAAGASQAAFTLYTDEAAYLAAVGATLEYLDFNPSPPGGAVVGGFSFSPNTSFFTCTDPVVPACDPTVVHNSNAITDIGGSSAPNGVAALGAATILAGVRGVAFNYISGGIASVNLFDSASTLIDSVDTSSARGFIGLVSDAPLLGGLGLTAVNAVFAGNIGNDRYFFDDFRINGTVPEPATYGLLALGLAGIAGITRRRRAV